MQTQDSVTTPLEESSMATAGEWPEGLAAVLTGGASRGVV